MTAHMTPLGAPATESEPSPPLERGQELAVLGAAMAGAGRAGGALVVVEGPGGIGKSALLDAAARAGEDEGLWVLRARASELEQSFAFGVALQLFEPALRWLSEDERTRLMRGAAALASPLLVPGSDAAFPAAGTDFSVIHGLYWLAANLAEHRPLAILVDDAQWADEASLRLCAYLAERIDELPVALVVAARAGEPSAPAPLLAGLAGHRTRSGCGRPR
jgi:predicted ATPase